MRHDADVLLGMHPCDALDKTLLGWSLKPPKWARKKLKQVKKLAAKVGPVASLIVPGAGPAIASATRVLDAAEKGDIKALGKITSIQSLASVSPLAAGGLEALNVARTMKRQVAATGLLAQAKRGSPRAAQQVAKLAEAARSGNPKAIAAYRALQNANEGAKMREQGRIPSTSYAADNNQWVMQIVKTVGPAKPSDVPPWLSSGYEDDALAILGEIAADELEDSAKPSFEDEDLTITSEGESEGGPIADLLSLQGQQDVDENGEL